MTLSCLRTCSTSVSSSSSGGRLGSRTITTISPGIQLKIVLGSPITSMALRDIPVPPCEMMVFRKHMRFCLFFCTQNGLLPKVSVYGIIADGAIRNNVQIFRIFFISLGVRGQSRTPRLIKKERVTIYVGVVSTGTATGGCRLPVVRGGRGRRILQRNVR